jgi:LmbE family N-acetylglucosaminyl deacetylase
MAAQHLLVLTAHPDDEGFGLAGTLARCAAEGWHITVVCATRGEVGEIRDPTLATRETLPRVREQELRDACAVLGVHDVRLLGYRDSGMEGTPENADPRALINADPEAVIADYDRLLRELRPSVVVTWDPAGGYGHPDHRAVHRLATAAVQRARDAGYSTAVLYYMVAPVEMFDEMARELAAQGIEFVSEEIRAAIQRLPHLPPTTAIDVRPWLPQKLTSMARHRTQIGQDDLFARLPERLCEKMLATEYFHRALPPWHAAGEGATLEAFFAVAT